MRYLFIMILFAGLGCQRNEGQYPHYRLQGVCIEKIYTPETQVRVYSGAVRRYVMRTMPEVFELKVEVVRDCVSGVTGHEIVTVTKDDWKQVQLGNTLRFERNRLVSVK